MTIAPITPISSNNAPAFKLPDDIQEVAITVAARNLDPTILNEQFLKFSGIIPEDWELARQPVLGPQGSQIVFKNGLAIVAQPRTVTFTETIGNRNISEILVAEMARQYASKLPKAEYQGLTISPKCLVPFADNADGARQYITQTLLAPGPWQDFGKAPVQAGVNFLYQFETCQLNLAINQATIQIPEQPNVAALLFAGNFNYPIENPSTEGRLALLGQYLEGWQSDLQTFRSMIYDRFLVQQSQPVSVFG